MKIEKVFNATPARLLKSDGYRDFRKPAYSEYRAVPL